MNTKIVLFFLPITYFFTNIFSIENSEKLIPTECLIEYLNRKTALATMYIETEKYNIKQHWRGRSLVLFLLKRRIMKDECITKECVVQYFQQIANFLDDETRKEMEQSLCKKIDKFIKKIDYSLQ